MIGLLCNWFSDWGKSIQRGLGGTGLLIFVIALLAVAILLFYGIIRSLLITVKRKMQWGYLVMLIITVLFLVWFTILLEF